MKATLIIINQMQAEEATGNEWMGRILKSKRAMRQ